MKKHPALRLALPALLLAATLLIGQAAGGAGVSRSLPEVVDAPFVFDYALPEADPVSMDYFKDAAFIGGNQIGYLQSYQPLQAGAWFTRDDISASNLAAATFQWEGKELLFAEALRASGCKKIYLMLGPGPVENDAAFVQVYSDLIAVMRSALPDAQIYLQTFLPVTASWAIATKYNNELFRHRNELLQQVAREQQVYLVDVASAFATPGGALPDSLSTDGLYLTTEGHYIWIQYLLTHTMGT